MDKLRIQPPSLLYTAMELRILYEFPSCFLSNFLSFTEGDKHPVLVLPGFLGNDLTTYSMRSFFSKLGYASHGWRLGLNLGYSEKFEAELFKVLHGIYYFFNKKVSIVGWSLGGIFAREIAKKHPEMVRNVITLGSPFNDIMTCTNLKWLYKIVGKEKIEDVNKRLLDNLSNPPAVPTTAIYSNSDGVVSGKGCKNKKCSGSTENISVWSSHVGLGFNLMVYKILADRLAQTEDNWKPYRLSEGKLWKLK